MIFFHNFRWKSEFFFRIGELLSEKYLFMVLGLCSKTLFLFKYYRSYKINIISKIILFFDFTMASQHLIQVSSLVTEIQNLQEKICSFLYNTNLFKNWRIPKKFLIHQDWNKLHPLSERLAFLGIMRANEGPP